MQDIRPQLRRYTAWLCALGMSYFMVKLLWMLYQVGLESFNYGILLLVIALLTLTTGLALNRPLALRITAALCLFYGISSGISAITMLSFGRVPLELLYPLLTVPLAGAAAYLLNYRSTVEKTNQREQQEQDGQTRQRLLVSWGLTLLSLSYLFWVAFTPLRGVSPFFFNVMLRLLALILAGLVLAKLVKGLWAWRQQRPIAARRAAQLALLLAATLIAIWRIKAIEQQAISYLTEKANQLQQQCDKQQTCPARVDGWQQGREFEFKASDGSLFQMRYYPEQSLFHIYINYGLDAGYFLQGGVGKPVTRQ
ncbi:MAG: hypothetical protein KAY06_02580 [Aeromonadaceae bacterium]|nr:hypothetical protein [Aeromonadaceae bacterium]